MFPPSSCLHLSLLSFPLLQLLKAKAIAEGKVIGPKNAQLQLQQKDQKKVSYEPYDFPDGMFRTATANKLGLFAKYMLFSFSCW